MSRLQSILLEIQNSEDISKEMKSKLDEARELAYDLDNACERLREELDRALTRKRYEEYQIKALSRAVQSLGEAILFEQKCDEVTE